MSEKMSVFINAQRKKHCPCLRGWVKKWQNSVHVIVECPLCPISQNTTIIFLKVCRGLAKSLPYLLFLPTKLDNPYYHNQQDCDSALDVILSENSSTEISETPCIVKITKFMACKEVMTVGSAYKWNYLYIIVTGFEILCHLNPRR